LPNHTLSEHLLQRVTTESLRLKHLLHKLQQKMITSRNSCSL